MATTNHVETVREFNRFYTARMGLTRGSYARPLPEIRVLYELSQGTTEVADLRKALEIDPGQLSRVLSKLEEQGLATRSASPPGTTTCRPGRPPSGDHSRYRAGPPPDRPAVQWISIARHPRSSKPCPGSGP